VFGRFLDRGELFTIQTGVNGIVVVVLLPRRHLERPQRYARAIWEEIATALDMLAAGLRASDVEQLRDVAGQLRGVRQVGTDWETTLGTAREVVLFNPTLWKSRAPLAELNRLFLLAKRTETTMEMLARQSLSMVEEVGHLPAIGEVIADCGSAAHRVSTAITHWDRPTGARAILLAVAAQFAGGDRIGRLAAHGPDVDGACADRRPAAGHGDVPPRRPGRPRRHLGKTVRGRPQSDGHRGRCLHPVGLAVLPTEVGYAVGG